MVVQLKDDHEGLNKNVKKKSESVKTEIQA